MIKIQDISKRYLIGKDPSSTLRNSLSSIFKKKTQEEFWALRNINLNLEKGESIGIVGKNGAGKSTLLKIISKITHPTTGKVILQGRVSSLLEVGTGFHQELTGRENIYLYGTLLGMTVQDIKQNLDDIIAFSEVEKYIDTPVKFFSSGMYVRLAFAVIAHLRADILLIDEVFSVGDAGFQEKCLNKMLELKNDGKTIIAVSHQMENIINLCENSILLSEGKIIDSGDSLEIIKKYLAKDTIFDNELFKNFKFQVITSDEDKTTLQFSFYSLIKQDNAIIDIGINNLISTRIAHLSSSKHEKYIDILKGNNLIEFKIDNFNLRSGKYFIDLYISVNGSGVINERNLFHFVYKSRHKEYTTRNPGNVIFKYSVKHEKNL